MKDVAIQSFWTILFFFILAAPSLLFCRKYSIAAHWAAFSKALFLWLISSSPIIAAILMSKPDIQIEDVPEHIQRQFLTNFSITEMFVYSASFLSPVLYVVFEVLRENKDGNLKLEIDDLKKHLRGMQWIFLTAFIILILTFLAYAIAKSDPDDFESTVIYILLTGKGYLVYFVSLFVWYTVILWDENPEQEFVKKGKQQSKDFADAFAQRKGRQNG